MSEYNIHNGKETFSWNQPHPCGGVGRQGPNKRKVKVKEVDIYSAFIEVPYTQGAQVRITQCYLQITPYLPLPRKHSPDGASQTEVAAI